MTATPDSDGTPAETAGVSNQQVAQFQVAMVRANRRLNMLTAQRLQPHLTGPQCFVLFLIRELGPVPVSKLAEKMEVKPSAITVMLDRLVHSGLVDRIPCEKDRRIVLVQLTAEGSRTLANILLKTQEMLASCLKDIPHDEMSSFLATFDKIVRFIGDLKEDCCT